MKKEEVKEETQKRFHHTYSLFPITYSLNYGGVAQLGEHLPCKQGVRSSILLISTTKISLCTHFYDLMYTKYTAVIASVHLRKILAPYQKDMVENFR